MHRGMRRNNPPGQQPLHGQATWQQHMMHKNMHQLIAGLNAVMFNQSEKGRVVGRFSPRGFSGGYGRNAHGRGRHSYCRRGCGP
jgi:hypothetical protein